MILHATTLARWTGGEWRAVLLQGPSGVGKSDLALRAIAQGWRLVADDRTLVWMSGGRLFGRAPATLAGLIEVRQLDILAYPALPCCELRLAVACVAAADGLERIPDRATAQILQARLPHIRLFAREPSAPAKLALALDATSGALTGRRRSVSSWPAAPRLAVREDV